MSFSIDAPQFVAFMLALIRAGTWIALTPPLNNRSIPVQVKSGLAAGLALAAIPHLTQQLGPAPYDTAALIGAGMTQAVIGASLGFFAMLLFASLQSAGALIDVFGGFSISAAYDPFMNAQSTVFGRLYEMVALVMLFAINGQLVLVRGFLTSFDAIGLRAPAMNHLAALLTHDLGVYFVAAVEVAAPLLAALFLAQIVLGLLARAAPSMNIFAISFPFTILLTFLLAGLAIPLLPNTINTALTDVIRSWSALGR